MAEYSYGRIMEGMHKGKGITRVGSGVEVLEVRRAYNSFVFIFNEKVVDYMMGT